MAEAIGFASSIIAVVGLSGQVIQGCQNIRGWVGDFNSAPKDVQCLVQELDSIEESAKVTDMLRTKIVGQEVHLQLALPLQQCLDAVQELRKHIADADAVFQKTGHSRKSRGWQRLKVVFNKQVIRASVDRLSRAKAQLVVAQSNVSLYFSQWHQEQLGDINESLSLSLRASQDSASILDRMNESIQYVHYQTEDTATAIGSLKADIKHYFEESRQPSNMLDTVAMFEKAMEMVLQKQVDQAPIAHKGRAQTELVTCMSTTIAECNIPRHDLDAALLGPHYHTKRKLLCRTPVITVSKTTSTANVQLEDREDSNDIQNTREANHSYGHISTLEVLMDLGLWRLGLKAVVGYPRRPHISDLDFRLSTYHIVDKNAPIFRAARFFDIETVRTLFASGCASPFDQTTSGYSLFDWVFNYLCESEEVDDTIEGLELLKCLVNCGSIPTSLGNKLVPGNFTWVERAMREHKPAEDQQILAEAIRLMFRTSSQDPISNWDVGICMSLKSQRTAVGEAITQQSQWPIKLESGTEGSVWGSSTIIENDRQILEDEKGLRLTAGVMGARGYVAINPTRQGWRAPAGIHSILHLYHYSEWKKEINAGCKNRIIILLKAGSDPRAIDCCPFDVVIFGDLEMSVTQYALFTNTLDLWKEALEDVGWSRADVESLLDEELYLGVPELFLGELEFKSQAQNREEFVHDISTGVYIDLPSWDPYILATYLNMKVFDVQDTITKGCQAFEMRSTPGSWHENGVSNLVLGVDFFIWKTFSEVACHTSFDDYYRFG